jgi:nucleoside-diphosphate-sugar epimerase
MRILLTGSDGFIGQNLQKAFIKRDWNVKRVDIKSGHDAVDFFKSTTVAYDVVAHCAAVVGGREVIDGNPSSQFANFELDACAIDYCERAEAKLIAFSSSAAYPTNLQTLSSSTQFFGSQKKLKETDIDLNRIYNPDAFYGFEKIALEKMLTFTDINRIVFRPFSGYGSDQDDCYPFNALLNKVLQNPDSVSVWGDKRQIRDFIHVNDIVESVCIAIERDLQGTYNLCTGVETSFENLIRLMKKIAYPNASNKIVISEDISKPLGVMRRVGDPSEWSKFYTPKISIEQGISMALGEREKNARKIKKAASKAATKEQ